MASTAFTPRQAQPPQPQGARSFLGKLNGPWHKRALQTFMIIVIAHWAEHLVQAYQVYVLKWPVHEARGVLGQVFPWLVDSEMPHYGYAGIVLAGSWALLPGFVGQTRACGRAALVVQCRPLRA